MKIAIIGAGPGGLYAALEAAGHGFHADVFEKGRVGDGITCGECIFDSLGIMTKPACGLLHPVETIVLQARKTYRLSVKSYRSLWMMDRAVWQRDLAEQAAVRGVKIHEGERISTSRLMDLKKDYDWIIDAGGAPSITSRSYGFSGEYFRKYMLAYQVVIRGDFSSLVPGIKAGFLADLPQDVMPGYFWVFPRDGQTANVGVGCAVGDGGGFNVDLKALLVKVLAMEGLAGRPVLKKGGGLIPARILPRLFYDNILLAGDAAGLTSSLHGGGIDLACLSGVLAVRAIAEGPQGPENYRDRLLGFLREKLAMEDLMVEKMRTLSFNEFDDLLHAAARKGAIIRTKMALRHPDLLWAAWKWLKTEGHLKI